MPEWPPLERTLDPAAYYSLYRGALAADSVQRRLARCYVILLGGRLGLRPGELLHCHEGWVDWGRGELRVPALDPCACDQCWTAARARQAAGDERPLAEIVRTTQWSPETETGARTIAFGWSERLTGLLATFFDYLDYLEGDRSTVAELVAESAEAAEGIDLDGLTPSVLRATSGRFLAEVGFDATTIQHVLGLDDRAPAEAFVRHAGQRTTAAMYRVFDREAIGPDVPPSNPARKFPIVSDPTGFNREPFDAPAYGHEARFERAEAEAGRRIRNPRPVDVPDGFEYDPETHAQPEQADAEGGQFSRTAGADAADMAALRDWITRKDASLRADSAIVDSGAAVAPGMEIDGASEVPSPTGDGPPAEPEPLGTAATDGAATARDPGRIDPEPDPSTVDEAVTSPLVARVSTRFATERIADGHPVEGQVILGQEEILLVSPPTDGDLEAAGVEHVPIQLDEVADVVPDASPDHLDGALESSLGVVWEGGGGRDVAIVELEGQRKWDFWTALFRNALHVSQMQITHPARVGGRVTEETATPGMLYLSRERVRFTPIGSDSTLLSIDLDDVLHVERTRQSVDGDRQPALTIQQFQDGEAVTSLVGSAATRTLKLFERFVRRDYVERLREARSLTIPDREKEVLVALYSTGEGVDLSNVFRRDESQLRTLVRSLAEKDLLTEADVTGTGLTAKGRLVVSDRLESVNE